MTEQSSKQKQPVAIFFFTAALILFATGMLWGIMGALSYVFPGLLKSTFSFEKIRPLHVSSVVFWIILSAIGSVASFLQQHTGRKIYSPRLLRIQFFIFCITIILILCSYLMGKFGGREYWEFHPVFAIPIVIGWILFLINMLRSIRHFKKQPVYIWMWCTGIVFFLFTFLESYLWLFPYFRNNIVNDMTIQWKSYGSMVGSWNMLIYGSSIFLLDKISGSQRYSYSRIAFLLYFLGLFNLMFNWGHHIYTLPTHSFIKHIGYLVSMTELILLGRIIYLWKSSLSTAKKQYHLLAYRFLLAADIWILLTLILAIAMSVPAINVYTHGTHITVAHTMGATIGINSFLILAFITDIFKDQFPAVKPSLKFFNAGYWIANIALFIFWVSLVGAGILKAQWQMSEHQIPFGSMMQQLHPYFIVFFVSGILLTIGFLFIIFVLLRQQRNACKQTREK